MKIRVPALAAMVLVAGACARGGEADADAALMDTTAQGITITGDTATALPPAIQMDSAAAPAVDSTGAVTAGTDSMAAPAAHDSAAHD